MSDVQSIAVIGLGYVGLPLAIEFAKHYKTIGLDIDGSRIAQLKQGVDETGEVDGPELDASDIHFSSNVEEAKLANVYIITVPTPVDENLNPNLGPLRSATKSVASVLKKGDTVIYESTVYPGCTEEGMVPILERETGLVYNVDFFCGYSPERMNPGDKNRTVTKIVKVTSGSTPATAKFVDELYAKIVTAGTYNAGAIKVAEAAKVIENSQRDINIAFVNELAIIFEKMGLDTNEVLAAAKTKWNFLPFTPGLVGGHCIGVDPYYLTHKAQALGYHPQIILAGRRINDKMGEYIAQQIIKKMIKKSIPVNNAKAAILGITFKENCPDIRNSKVISIVEELEDFGVKVDIFDPNASSEDVKNEYGRHLGKNISAQELETYDTIVFAVAHSEYREIPINDDWKKSKVIYDVKGILPKGKSDLRL